MTASSPMVKLEGLDKRFGPTHAVRGIDLEVARGETLALLGPNGGGKTTVLRALVGLHSPTGGRVLIDGLDVAREGDGVRELLSYLPQRASMPGLLTAREVLDLFTPTDLKHKVDAFVFIGVLMFIVIVIRRVLLILEIF